MSPEGIEIGLKETALLGGGESIEHGCGRFSEGATESLDRLKSALVIDKDGRTTGRLEFGIKPKGCQFLEAIRSERTGAMEADGYGSGHGRLLMHSKRRTALLRAYY
jgi:hypothetical protein